MSFTMKRLIGSNLFRQSLVKSLVLKLLNGEFAACLWFPPSIPSIIIFSMNNFPNWLISTTKIRNLQWEYYKSKELTVNQWKNKWVNLVFTLVIMNQKCLLICNCLTIIQLKRFHYNYQISSEIQGRLRNAIRYWSQ